MIKVECPCSPDSLPFQLVEAMQAFDVWSFGALSYALLTGAPMFKVNRDDDLQDAWSMKKLYDWGEEMKAEIIGNLHIPLPKSLMLNLLVKEETRCATMTDVLKDRFFTTDMNELIDSIEKGQAQLKEGQSKILNVIKDMTMKQKSELVQMQEVLLRGIFEATEVNVPTTFVILQEELLSKEKEEELRLILKEDGSGFDVEGKLVEDAKKTIEEGVKWVERLTNITTSALSGNVKEALDAIKEGLGDLVNAKELYFYLVDELTGKPVRGKGYPVKITKPSELVHKLVPCMQIGLRAMSLYNGVAGIARMFHPGIPTIPEEWCKGASDSIALLK
mmetsp:Transcript_14389/g.19704  ORF Transcript_14389/g.19704 Transcript_14389/m.19704 type:complete len:333 (-) Transcript_14389:471-1469(-)